MYPEGPDRAFDVLQRKAAQILERRLHPPGNGIADVARNQDAACRRFAFQPCCHIDAVAVEVVAVYDQVAEVQAHAEHERSVWRLVRGSPRPLLVEIRSLPTGHRQRW